MTAMLRFLEALLGPGRSVANARTAATEMSQRLVERQEVEIYLAERKERISRSA
ncbi:MAG TPA: hypothetical protein VFH56_12225 [Acidimicrobiales bacterium]|nr:hypothetical protein [Acidimicrobiales bacterium]